MLAGPVKAEHLRGGHDPAVQIPRRQAEEEKLQQAGLGDPQRVLLLPPLEPLPVGGGQGGARQEVQYYSITGVYAQCSAGLRSRP